MICSEMPIYHFTSVNNSLVCCKSIESAMGQIQRSTERISSFKSDIKHPVLVVHKAKLQLPNVNMFVRSVRLNVGIPVIHEIHENNPTNAWNLPA